MDVKLSEIVKSNYCYYELHSGCVKGLELPDDEVCHKCVAEAHADIVKSSLADAFENVVKSNGTR